MSDLMLLLGKEAYISQQYPAALKYFETGYLRVGNILQRQKNYDQAFKIYQYGLRKVSTEAPDYRLLQEMHHKLFLRYPPCKGGDPMKVLPPEVIRMVFSYLDFKNKVGVMRVAHSWQDFVASVPIYWTDLDFSQAKVQVKVKAIQKYVGYSKGKISRAAINQTAIPSAIAQGRVTEYITTKCPGLEYLQTGSGFMGYQFSKAVSVASNLKTLIMSNKGGVPLDAVSLILSHCKRLETAEFHYIVISRVIPVWENMLNMHSLTLGLPGPTPAHRKPIVFPSHITTINKLLRVIPHIRSLSLQNWHFASTVPTPDFSHLAKLEDLKLVKFQSEGYPRIPSSIVSLDLSDSDSLVSNSAAVPSSSEMKTVPGLAQLLLPGLYYLQPAYLELLLRENQSKLRTLNIADCCDIVLSNIHWLINSGNLDRIIELILNNCYFGDAEATSLANRCYYLRVADLSGTAITGVGVKALVLKPGDRLDRLIIRSCRYISGDAIEFAQSAGVEVILWEPKNEVRSKKVRTAETGMYVDR
ncbi:MAG: hypothetical protein Q9167_002304 [Letrouitia subvulpina]